MERMVAAPGNNSQDTQSPRNDKRKADETPQEGSPSPKVSKTASSSHSIPASHSTLSPDNFAPGLAQPQTPAFTARHSDLTTPRHPENRFAEPQNDVGQYLGRDQMSTNIDFRIPPPQIGKRPAARDSWAAWSTAHSLNQGINPYGSLPTSTHDVTPTDALDSQVKQLLTTTVHNLGKGNAQPYDFPYKYILRGPEKVKATINSVTLPEHLWGIFRIIHHAKTDPDIKPCLMLHIEQIIEDAREFDWELGVRRWSEEVFSRISEGRLPNGWHAYDEISRMRMVIAQSKPIGTRPQNQQYYKDTFHKKQPLQNQNQPQTDIHRRGPPCPDYNSPTGWTLSSGHIKQGKRLVHVCSFCLLNTSTANYHPETYCRNKVCITGNNNHF